MTVSLCVPMYNESSIIADTAMKLHTYMSEQFGNDFEIIFSDDGSKDRSAEIVNELNLPNVRVVGYENNRGKGSAVRHGVLSSQGEIVVFTDADLAYGLDVIKCAVDELQRKKYSVVVASRAVHPRGYEGYGFVREMASKVYIKVVNLLGGVKISDSQCGFKAFDGEKGRKIFSYCATNNFAFDLEVILIAQKLKLKIYEMPAMIVNHRDSKISILKDAPKMVREILQIKKRVKKLDLSRELA